MTTLLALAPFVSARTVALTSSSPFRSGPNKSYPSQAQIPAGTTGEVVGETNGWLQLKLQDGRTGYVFQRNVRDVPDEVATTTSTLATAVPPPALDNAPPTTIASPIPEDLPSLKNEIATMRAKMEQMNEALKVQREAHPDDGSGERATDPATRDSVVSMAAAGLLVGLILGWTLSRLAQRRSDRRQWNKLRL